MIDLARHQNQHGHDAQIAFTSRFEKSWEDVTREDYNVTVIEIGSGSRYSALLKLRRLLLASQYDVVHLHIPAPWLAFSLTRSKDTVLILHLHVRPTAQAHGISLRQQVEKFGTKKYLNQCDAIVSVSDWVSAEWQSEYKNLSSPFTKIYNGITVQQSTSPSAKEPTKQFTIGIACRLSRQKGIEEFLELAQTLHSLDKSIRFKIAGEGPMLKVYTRAVMNKGLGEVIDFVGFVDNIDEFWKTIDLAIFTAPFEPFGLRLIEPLACGVPVVAFKNGSGSDEVIASCRGILSVEYGDFTGMCRKIFSLLQSKDEKKQLSSLGLLDVREHFTIEVMSKQIEQVYLEAATRKTE